MRKLKVLMMLFVTLFACQSLVYGQQDKHEHSKRANRQKEQLSKLVNLSDEQGQQVYDALMKFLEVHTEIRKSGNDATTQQKQEKENARNYEIALKSILTAEQHQKLTADRKARQAAKQQQQSQSATQPPAEHVAKAKQRRQHLTKQVQLSDEQGQQVHEAVLKFWKMRDEIKDSGKDAQARQRLNKQNHANHQAEIKAILTEEQNAKLEEIRKKRN